MHVRVTEPYYSGPLLNNIERAGLIRIHDYENLGVPNVFIRNYGTKNDFDKFLRLDKESIRKSIIEKLNA